MSVIVPAILTNNLNDFTEKLTLIGTFPDAHEVHIDFADNKFVPNLTLQPVALPSLPLKFSFTAHLMTLNPESFLADLERVGFEGVSFHYEAVSDIEEIKAITAKIKHAGMKSSLAVNPKTAVQNLMPLLKTVEAFHIMTVEPGFQGRHHIAGEEKIKFLRSSGFYGTIIVDGGINKNNLQSLLAAGADKVVVGSAIFKSQDPLQTYTELLKSVSSD